jgi:hypothetical protein
VIAIDDEDDDAEDEGEEGGGGGEGAVPPSRGGLSFLADICTTAPKNGVDVLPENR